MLKRINLLIGTCLLSVAVFAQQDLFELNFDQDSLGQQIFGFSDEVSGISGSAIQWDGFTSWFEQSRFKQNLPDEFTINAWAAVYAYPWFRCPVFDLRSEEQDGLILGIDRYGKVTAALGTPLDWQELTGPQVQHNSWFMLTLIYSKKQGVNLYLNGTKVASIAQAPQLRMIGNKKLTIGRNAILEDWWDYQYTVTDHYSFWDGPMDEIKVTSGAMNDQEIKDLFTSKAPIPKIVAANRKFPEKDPGLTGFGAYYTSLPYTPQWDRLWRTGDHPDIVVHFPNHDSRLVFWRGTSFVPCWVTENNIWYTNEWTETWGSDATSCAEPLMDRECRNSHVRIIENTPARVIIHWRYALVDADYNYVALDVDGRGEWTDEYYIIYPDGIGIRRIDLHYSKPLRNHDWEEAIVVLPPGVHPDEVIRDPEVTLANMKGETADYSWRNNLPVNMEKPQKANIHLVNLNSQYRPFYIIDDAPFTTKEGRYDSPFFRTYAAFMASDYRPPEVPSIYGWWNHWPITPVPGDGRWVEINDRASHFNLTTYTQWKDYQMDERTKTRIMLHGMTDQKAEELVPLASSWLNPPALKAGSQEIKYEPAERAYIVESGFNSPYKFELQASPDQKACRPAIVLEGIRLPHPDIRIDGQELKQGDDYELGVVVDERPVKTVVWFNREFDRSVTINMTSGIH